MPEFIQRCKDGDLLHHDECRDFYNRIIAELIDFQETKCQCVFLGRVVPCEKRERMMWKASYTSWKIICCQPSSFNRNPASIESHLFVWLLFAFSPYTIYAKMCNKQDELLGCQHRLADKIHIFYDVYIIVHYELLCLPPGSP